MDAASGRVERWRSSMAKTETTKTWTPERITRLQLALVQRMARSHDGLTLALWVAFCNARSYRELARKCELMERYIGGDIVLSGYWHALIGEAKMMGEAA